MRGISVVGVKGGCETCQTGQMTSNALKRCFLHTIAVMGPASGVGSEAGQAAAHRDEGMLGEVVWVMSMMSDGAKLIRQGHAGDDHGRCVIMTVERFG